jgi:hypothetical protein
MGSNCTSIFIFWGVKDKDDFFEISGGAKIPK